VSVLKHLIPEDTVTMLFYTHAHTYSLTHPCMHTKKQTKLY